MIKYEAVMYKAEVNEIEVLRETNNFIVIPANKWGIERKHAKVSDSISYFDTFEDAKKWIMDGLSQKIKSAESDLDGLKYKKQKINNTNHANHS